MFKSRNEVKLEGNMSSMTDLVFLLLIFFMIMSTMSQQGLPVDLPSTKKSNDTKKNSTVNIGITEDNQYFFKEDVNKYYSYQEMEGILLKKMEAFQENEEKILRIHGDSKSDLQQAINILGLAKQMEWKPVLVTKAE